MEVRVLATLITLTLLLMSFGAQADCFDMAGRDYHIDADLLRAVSFRESSFRPGVVNNSNEDGYAVGLMQIYSSNFSHLSQYGITPDKLRQDPCLNIYTGAYYLALAFKRWGYTWRAVGAYNAGFKDSPEQEEKRREYAEKIKALYRKIKSSKAPEIVQR
ncbi:transglycosylase SLT domain-containing protein [Klebsiella aerogenes]|uniref:transglycosylase SLT domain-containing protein n=1 Tax=Klebsiella aerogenes TaxID=548 RepID=UPI000DA147F6|nr:transglycosylase SLT domain-containing protein [Klebsiella aerogenes]HCB2859857.1 transglycosylase SLT domain-containing protein [Klebsiella aerogenes]HCB2864860.1 transglycosylase SLT domain-containing protein [Klebsiella aerogenes]HCB2880468.1 transglycosylase SLT domain-containing protein [Klebsiella aerogenes]HCB3345923.1 transglycosylase SLT domain-containing protein [Klebsiella aerogenes]HCM1811925.1 transglycosylase SLT domain-containing protein [Klebsiella aerogenes]